MFHNIGVIVIMLTLAYAFFKWYESSELVAKLYAWSQSKPFYVLWISIGLPIILGFWFITIVMDFLLKTFN